MPLPSERRYTSADYWSLPEGQRAELIDGQLYNMAPPSRIHQKLISQFTLILGEYIRENPVKYTLLLLLSIWIPMTKIGWSQMSQLFAIKRNSPTEVVLVLLI